MPRQTGQTLVFGGSPKRVEQEQKIFEAVSSCTWTSSPMTGSYFARTSSEMDTLVAMREIIDALADQARRLQRPQRLKPRFKSEAYGAAESRAPSRFSSTCDEQSVLWFSLFCRFISAALTHRQPRIFWKPGIPQRQVTAKKYRAAVGLDTPGIVAVPAQARIRFKG